MKNLYKKFRRMSNNSNKSESSNTEKRVLSSLCVKQKKSAESRP